MTHKELLAVCRHYLGSHYYYRKVVDQIKEYTDGIGLTFDDIARILVYWYDVKKADPARAGGGIGIVPHIYKEALEYYEAQKQFKEVADSIQEYTEPEVERLVAPSPYMVKPKTLKMFELKQGGECLAKPNYYDTSAAIQVIGCTILQPNLLNEDGQYFYSADDFVTEIHRVAFGAVFNLHQMGAERITPKTIEDYLQGHPESYGIYQQSKGSEWLQNCINTADIANFDYYYSRLKKMTLLRGYTKAGVDMTWLYDPDNLLDIEKKEQQENYLNRISLNELADIVDNKILTVRDVYVDNATDHALRIGDSVAEVLASLEETPEVGAPFADKGLNGITRGARYGKYYLRSAPTGVGKTRSMLADACYMACNAIFDPENGEWIQKNNQPVLFISTELDVEELTTMALAFLTGYNEEDILLQRISFSDPVMVQAAQVLKESPLYLEILPDYTIKQVENTIKRNIRINHTKVVFR